ncbi:MAG: TetR family transcriptional regulator [Solirubrobacteraceae bacterium]|nr:TetR family transcriptional regulator [Solirubrobacteraceae bacterium]
MPDARRIRLTYAERRGEILDAAARVIVARGLHAFRIRDVADEAGVSQPLVSTHFRSREELVLEAFERADERALQTILAHDPHDADGRARAVAYLDAIVAASDEPDDGIELWHQVWTHATFSDAIRDAVHVRQTAWIARLAERIRSGQDDGSVAPTVDAASTAQLLVVVIDGLAPSQRAGLIDRATALRMLDDAIDAFLPAG